MYKYYKNCNYLKKKIKQLFLQKDLLSIFCAIMTRGTILKFIEFVRLCHSQQCHHTQARLVPVCIRIIVQMRQFSVIHFICLHERILLL